MKNRTLNHRICWVIIACIFCFQAHGADENSPLVRGPGVSQELLETFAEAQGRTTLSDYLDQQRPPSEAASKLSRLLERAQAAWLSGTMTEARSLFKDIARLSLEADWRESQREAIQYSMMRLAQSAASASERGEWLEKAASGFPDLHPDSDSFPPPLMEGFNATRARILAQAAVFHPFEHFPNHRYLFINGKKFVISVDLKIRLPKGQYRIAAFSDVTDSLSEVMPSSQLMNVHPPATPIASGTCSEPSSTDVPKGVRGMTIMYSSDCQRTRTRQSGWLAANPEIRESKSNSLTQRLETPFPLPTPEPEASWQKNKWVWAGLSVLAASAGYFAYREFNRSGEWEFGF